MHCLPFIIQGVRADDIAYTKAYVSSDEAELVKSFVIWRFAALQLESPLVNPAKGSSAYSEDGTSIDISVTNPVYLNWERAYYCLVGG